MLVLKTFKNLDTNKILRARLVAEDGSWYSDYNAQALKEVVKNHGYIVSNMEIDKYGNLKMKNINPKTNRKAYFQEIHGNTQINYYCALKEGVNGLLSYIADTPNGTLACGYNVTVGEIASHLGVSLDKMHFINAIVKMEKSRATVYIYKDTGNYRKIPNVLVDKHDLKLDDDWDKTIMGINQEGISIGKLGNAKGYYKSQIPDGICHLEKFLGGVNKLSLPVSLRTLGEGCFENLEDLEVVQFSDGLPKIPKNCFRNSLIKDVKFTNSQLEIDDYAFYDCYKLQGPIITNAARIGKHAFYDTAIRRVNLLGAKVIDIEAFAYNEKLTSVKLSSSLKEIKGGAFRGCTSLKEIVIPSTVDSIGRMAFYDCKNLKKIQIAYGTAIGPQAIPVTTQIIRI